MTSVAKSSSKHVWILVGVALVLVKLWLVGAQTVCAIGPAEHDDRLFLNLARALLRGEWLGHYYHLTLAKGPMYPMWIAGSFLAGVPLFTSQHLLYATMCALLVAAMRPLLPGRWLGFLIFAVLLFNPMTFEAAVHGRIIRQDIYHSFALGTLAGLVAMHARRSEPMRKLVWWAVLLGGSFAAFWLTREEGVWILPLVVTLWAWLLIGAWREDRKRFVPRCLFLLSPLALFFGAVTTVCALNLHYYGVFATVEFKAAPFKDAYGALGRVTPLKWRPYIPVQREVRERIYAVSPAFAELRPYLEGETGEAWAGPGAAMTGIPPEEREIAGGWFMWALRDAVELAGHGRTGADAMAYYRKLADEVNAACDDGRLAAGPRHSGFVPVWNPGYGPMLRVSLARATKFFLTFDGFNVVPVRSIGPPDKLILFADLTRERLSPEQGMVSPYPQQRWLDRVRLPILAGIGRVYRALIVPVAVLAGIAWLAAIVSGIVRCRVSYWTVLNLGMMASIALMIFLNALIDATSFPSIHVGAFTACYPMYLLLLFTCWLQFRSSIGSISPGAKRSIVAASGSGPHPELP